MNPNSVLKKYKKKETKKYWIPNNEQEKLDRTLHRNIHTFENKTETKMIKDLSGILNNFIGNKRIGNQIIFDPEDVDKLDFILNQIPNEKRERYRELGEAFLSSWFESKMEECDLNE